MQYSSGTSPFSAAVRPTSRFQQSLLDPEKFTLTFELVPSRGGHGKEQSRIITLAREIAADGRLEAVSITENAGGHPALSPEVLGLNILRMGLEVISHFSCKDKNRNQIEGQLYAWNREGLHNLLVITGDYPQAGYRGNPKPVFDLDSVQALDLISRLNKGQTDTAAPIAATSFFKGVALSPFKFTEEELMMQYYKLHRKAAAGADYVITQVGYDLRKFHEVLLYVQESGLSLPVLGNVFIPNLTVGRMMSQGKIPGCEIPPELAAIMDQEANAADRGKKARLRRAAKLLAALKGLGYAGAHIGGPAITFENIDFVLEEAEKIAGNWQENSNEFIFPTPHSFYYFRKDAQTGLNRKDPAPIQPPQRQYWSYNTAQYIHDLAFAAEGLLFEPFKSICLGADSWGMEKIFSSFEHILKHLSFGCRNCGDCTLAELAYICPQSGCAKYLLNGPCGGSRNGWCEVYPGVKKCFYVRVYKRLKTKGLEKTMQTGFIPPRNWALNETSSWINFFKSTDHTAK